MNIPIQCERTKSIAVPKEFIHALEQTCSWKKAERLPDDSFCELYVGSKVLASMESSDNQIIWGRRGTGKTHLLKAFVQRINEDPECKKIAFYISCDKISAESPSNIKFSSDMEKMKYYARQTFKCFVSDFVEQMIDKYEDLLSIKCFYNEKYDIGEKEQIKKEIETQLLNLLDNCTYGIPTEIVKEETAVETKANEKKRESNMDAKLEGKLSFPFNWFAAISAKFGHKVAKTTNDSSAGETKVIKKYSFSLTKTRDVLERLLDALRLETVYICIDELWLIDQKREMSFQPLFLDYLRQAFLASHRISVKIASIREVTKLNSKTSAGNSYGLQSGHDIIELLNLDTQFIKEKDRVEHYKHMLYARINYFGRKEKQISDVYTQEFIVNTIFKSEKNLANLITLTHVIPRNFLNVLQRALFLIQSDLQHYFIHSYLIRKTVISMYLEDKRSNLPMNSGSLFDIINKYIKSTHNYFFLLSSEQVKRLKIEIDNLVYIEIIHQVPSSILPDDIMDNYKGFYIDSGKYLHTLKIDESDYDDSGPYNFSYVLPEFIIDNISNYIINLDHVESEFIECPNCGSQISKIHPVYTKANMCPTCAFEF